MEGVLKNGTPVEVGILFETTSFFPLFFTWCLVGTNGKKRRKSNHGVKFITVLGHRLYYPMHTAALHTGPYFAKCPSIASSFSLEGPNIVRSFTSEGHVEFLFSYNREIQTVTLTLGSLFTLTPNFNLKFYYSKSEEILLNQGYKMLKPSSILSNVQDSKLL